MSFFSILIYFTMSDHRLNCPPPEYFFEWFHLKSAYDHLRTGEVLAKTVGDTQTQNAISNSLCEVEPEIQSRFLYLLNFVSNQQNIHLNISLDSIIYYVDH